MRYPTWAWLGLLAAGAVSAATLTLTPTKDNTLYESASGALSNGSGHSLFVGNTSGGDLRRTLIAFDFSAVPAEAQLTRVALTLTLSKTNSSSGTQPLILRRVLADWGEGSSDAGDPGGLGVAAASGDATWLHTASSTAFWAAPGGDFADTPSASQNVAGTGAYTWESAQLLAEVQGWITSPADNHGWILLGNESATGTAKRFHSRESTAAQRPRLTIEYRLPNTPPTAGALPDLHLDLSGGGVSIDPAAAPALFRDPDGDTLSYRALSSDSSKVAASLAGNLLLLVPKAPGTATLTLSAEDGWGGSVSRSFAVQIDAAAAPLLVGDFDGDLSVAFSDFVLFADHFGETSSSPGWDLRYDLDASGGIDFDDFFTFADHFGSTAAP
ncbi:MAG: DNRLRE domain-containing protein [Candidatus Latescibacteria bacterium]|nr:DNRLRE domain-containing protein [Candidatus Latescibacterota bacterium]